MTEAAAWFFTVCMMFASPDPANGICYESYEPSERMCDYSLRDDEKENVELEIEYYVSENCRPVKSIDGYVDPLYRRGVE